MTKFPVVLLLMLAFVAGCEKQAGEGQKDKPSGGQTTQTEQTAATAAGEQVRSADQVSQHPGRLDVLELPGHARRATGAAIALSQHPSSHRQIFNHTKIAPRPRRMYFHFRLHTLTGRTQCIDSPTMSDAQNQGACLTRHA